MNEDGARSKIRALMTDGTLPADRPVITSISHSQIVAGQQFDDPCLVCEEFGPQISYTYPDGRAIRLHAACDALWQQERTR
jgi:hypothetical protein